MAVSNSWNFLGTHRAIFRLPEFVSDGSVVTHCVLSLGLLVPQRKDTAVGAYNCCCCMHLLQCHTWAGTSLSPVLEVWGVGYERESCSDPLDSIQHSVWVMQYKGNSLVLAATKEDAI